MPATAGATPTVRPPSGTRAPGPCAPASSTCRRLPPAASSPNGGVLDSTFQQYALVAEIEKRYELWGQPGKFKVTGFLNRGRAGKFQDAITLAQITGEPADIMAVRSYTEPPRCQHEPGAANLGHGRGIRPRRLGRRQRRAVGLHRHRPDGVGRRLDQRQELGPAGRYRRNRRVVKQGVPPASFNAGGLGVLIGDGQLPNSGLEKIFEAYYSYAHSSDMRVSFDYQFITNPAYNTDRGPVNVFVGRFQSRRNVAQLTAPVPTIFAA